MPTKEFISKKELVSMLGISRSTFYRRMRELQIPTSRKLLTLQEAEELKQAMTGRSTKTVSQEPPSNGII